MPRRHDRNQRSTRGLQLTLYGTARRVANNAEAAARTCEGRMPHRLTFMMTFALWRVGAEMVQSLGHVGVHGRWWSGCPRGLRRFGARSCLVARRVFWAWLTYL